jgi:hypothetical protein
MHDLQYIGFFDQEREDLSEGNKFEEMEGLLEHVRSFQ